MSASAPAAPPISGGGSTDPAYDWERVPAQIPPYTVPVPEIESTKTLDQTTKWLRWALERYGTNVRPTAYRSDIKDLRFRGCTMEWKVDEELGNDMRRLSSYEINLGDITEARGFGTYTRLGLRQRIRIKDRIFEKGKEKPAGESEESYVQLPVRKEEHISERVSWAFRHARRLCAGAPTR